MAKSPNGEALHILDVGRMSERDGRGEAVTTVIIPSKKYSRA